MKSECIIGDVCKFDCTDCTLRDRYKKVVSQCQNSDITTDNRDNAE